MSPRYYISTAILLAVLTLAISVWKQKQTRREIFGVLVKVIIVLLMLVGGIFGVAQFLAFLGVAQSGFLL